MNEILIFFAQFILVFLLGIQSQFVRDSNYIGAAITSLLLGIAGYYTTMQIALVKEMFTSVYYCYIIAGPMAITLSIWAHKRYLI